MIFYVPPCRGTQLGQNTCVLLPNNRKKLKKRRFAAIRAFEAILCNKNQNKTIQLDFRQVGSYLVECDNVHLHYFRSSKVTIQLLMISM